MIISHFTDKENEAQKEEVTGSRSPNQSVMRGSLASESLGHSAPKGEGPGNVQVRVSRRDGFCCSRHLRRKVAKTCPGMTSLLASSGGRGGGEVAFSTRLGGSYM